MKEIFQEKAVGILLVSGAVVSALCLVLSWMFASAGILHGTMTRTPGTDKITDAGDLNLVPLTFFFFTVGILMIVGGLGYGLFKQRTRFAGTVRVLGDVRVIVRQGFAPDWSMPLAEWEIENTPGAHYTVRIQTPDREYHEFECQPEVYFTAGEGMAGEATVQGKWMGRFVPYIGDRQREG